MQRMLRYSIFVFLFFLPYLSYGDDLETITMLDGKEYFNIEVLKKTPISLDISYYKTPDAEHRAVTTVYFSKMTEKYQKKYGYNKNSESTEETKDSQKPLKQNKTDIPKKGLKEEILEQGKPVIVKSGAVYNLDGSLSKQNEEIYKNTVFLGYKKYILDDNNIYTCDNPVDAKDYLKDLSKEINELKKELSPKLNEISETEYQIGLLNDRLAYLQKAQATRTYTTSTGTVTVSYDQSEVNKYLKEIEDSKAKLKLLNEQQEIVSLANKINEKETQYKNYSKSLAKLEKTDPNSAYGVYLNAVVVVLAGEQLGSGFFISKTGYIITNEHVVRGSAKVKIERYNKTSLTALVLKVDKEKDLALLKAEGSLFPYLEIEDTGNVKTGEDVIAIGTPKGYSWTITKGIISAIREEKGTGIIQTDVAANPGNSGGPLINVKTGKVVGIIRSGINESQGLNFAIAPSEIFKAFPTLNNEE